MKISKKNTLPKVSVVMSAFNAQNSIEYSIKSIINQTYSNFEFLIMDDCSTDDTFEIIKKYQNIDNRIKLFKNESNLGLTKSLNFLIENSNGELIARQDADDISLNIRLEKQVQYIIKKKVDGCSTKTFLKNTHNTIPNLSRTLYKKIILIFKNPYIHGTLMVKKTALKSVGNYDESFYYAQDYKLMRDLIDKNKTIKILKNPLYILNTINNISTNKKDEQAYYANCVRRKVIP